MSENKTIKPNKKVRYTIFKKGLQYVGIPTGVFLILFFAFGIYSKARHAYYDTKPAPITFSLEDITEFVDSNEDAKVSPVEMILMKSLKSKLEQAKEENKRMFISVGHINWDQWLKFKTLDDMALYCKLDHGFRNIHVEKSFHHIKSPTYCMVGHGGYFELDADGNLKALWIYRVGRAGWAHLIPYYLSFCNYTSYENKLGSFIDKNFGWQRIPSPVLEYKLKESNTSKKKAIRTADDITTPTFISGYNMAECFDHFKSWKLAEKDIWQVISQIEHDLSDNNSTKTKQITLKHIIEDFKQAKTPHNLHGAIIKHIDQIKKKHPDYKEARYELNRILSSACRQIIKEIPLENKSPLLEDALFYYSCLKSRETESAVDMIETLDRLERDYPASRYLPSFYIYKADAYVNLAKDVYFGNPQYNVSLKSAIQYYTVAFEQIDKSIEYISKNKDKALQGIPWGYSTSESMLQDSMIGSSTLRTAILLRTKIASDIRQKKIDVEYGSRLYGYLNGNLGPDLNIQDLNKW